MYVKLNDFTIVQLRADYKGPAITHPHYLETLNAQILQHIRLKSWLQLHAAAYPLLDVSLMQSENRLLRPNCVFWNLERMDQWHEAQDIENMIKQNACALAFLQQRLRQSGAPALPEKMSGSRIDSRTVVLNAKRKTYPTLVLYSNQSE